MNITYTEISDIVTYMKSSIELLCGTEHLEEGLEEHVIEYLSQKDIFNDGSKQDYDMREMTIIEAILKYFSEIDNIVLKLFIYDFVSEKQKKVLKEIVDSSLKREIKEWKDNQPGSITTVKWKENVRDFNSTFYRTTNMQADTEKVIYSLKFFYIV